MGSVIWVDTEGRDEKDFPGDIFIVYRLEDELCRLSEKLGVAELNRFYDYSVVAAELGNDEVPEVWSDPATVLVAVRAILSHLEQHPEDLGFKPDSRRLSWPGDLIAELKSVQSALELAGSKGRKVRFLIVP